MSASTRWLAVIGTIVLVAIVASAVLAVAVSGPDEFPGGTPERVVQQYLAAVSDGDPGAARSFFSGELLDDCEPMPTHTLAHLDISFRAEHEETLARDPGVEVRVRLTEIYRSGPFGRSESTWSLTMRLAEEDGAWRFVEAPWPLYCPAVPRTSP